MSIFSDPLLDAVTSYRVDTGSSVRGVAKVGAGGVPVSALHLASDTGANVDLSSQFIVFQFGNKLDGPAIIEASGVEPTIEGSQDQPDVLVALEMLSFQVGEQENVGPGTRATMRINFGKDESSTDKRFDTAFWSIAAGLNLYNQAKGRKSQGKELKADLKKAFGNRPIEIPGGLGKMTFEVVKHIEPPWWKKVFGFLRSDTAESLVSVLGFPAITLQAIDMLDELLNRLVDAEPEPLFKSLPMRLALSKYARDEFTGGNPRVRMGSLRQGFAILARGGDFERLNEADVIYYPTYGKLIPRTITEVQLLAGKYDDPLKNVTYAVFRIGTKSTKLDPTFNYSS